MSLSLHLTGQAERFQRLNTIATRQPVARKLPANAQGKLLKVSAYYGEQVFPLLENKLIKEETRAYLADVIRGKKTLTKEIAQEISHVVLEWALDRGVTHFCHWFQPLTGESAEKHDSFITFDGDRPIEKLSASQLIQGEPDASSFPSGGSRSTFEARGYTTWDLTSFIFIKEGVNGKTLCIPTAFISYHGDALDSKTPLLRSISALSKSATAFLKLCGQADVDHVQVTCGAEQEYFLIDKSLYFQRKDLVMTGRTLCGSLTPRHQQLEDHYFASIPERVLAYMQDVEVELYQLGIPAKTRHNEVAPGQFEIAPIFKEANLATDQNKILMDCLSRVAHRHHFVCLFHEKPFRGINGSGKHLNWSMSDSHGRNLLEPGKSPHENYTFLAMMTIVTKAVFKRSVALRGAIASHGNDHRLGANEAPPSIMSVFLGTTLTKILDTLAAGATYAATEQQLLDLGASQLASLIKDNTDRNRTSPFAFTGNKFEFRAVGSSSHIGLPLIVLNAAVVESLQESGDFLTKELAAGTDLQQALIKLIRSNYQEAKSAVFNGDGYSQDWVNEAQKRGLPNLRTTPEALVAFMSSAHHQFLLSTGTYREGELSSLMNVRLERYCKHRLIELETMRSMIDQTYLPIALEFKQKLVQEWMQSKSAQISTQIEEQRLKEFSALVDELFKERRLLDGFTPTHDEQTFALSLAKEVLPCFDRLAKITSDIEAFLPMGQLGIPSYFELLFVR